MGDIAAGQARSPCGASAATRAITPATANQRHRHHLAVATALSHRDLGGSIATRPSVRGRNLLTFPDESPLSYVKTFRRDQRLLAAFFRFS